MRNEDVMTGLVEIFRQLFENRQLNVNAETSPKDVKGWDSMANVTLAVEIEHRFRIRIRPAEMDGIHNVGDLAGLIERHLTPAAS